MTDPTPVLLPRPRHAEPTGSSWRLGRDVEAVLDGPATDLAPALGLLRRALAAAGCGLRRVDAPAGDDHPALRLRLRREAGLGPQGYRLSTGSRGAEIVASESAGLFYGAATVGQMLASPEGGGHPEVAGLAVEDRPSFTQRGVLLDVSRNRVPTMETLYRLVDRLASWKVNQLQLYTEHTFAYRDHERVWRDASPLTGDEVRALDAYCRERFVELVPNQQSFGHFHRWLVHEPYRRLAECPQGVEHPFSTAREPFSLCPTDPGSLELLAGLYRQLLPNFSSGLFNVGLDETFDLGRGRAAAECAQRGRHEVYLEFLAAVRDLAAEHGRRIQFWADIALAHPEALARIPPDAIPLAWGYEGDHPFAAGAATLAGAEREFYVCPGTSSWNSFAGRASNALENLASAALAGREHGAAGYLVTDWGDNGHLQPLAASWLGLCAGAAFAWNAEHADDRGGTEWHRLLDLHAFDSPAGGLGRAVLTLADVYRKTGTPNRNGTALFHLVVSPRDTLAHPRYAGLDRSGLEAVLTAVDGARAGLGAASPRLPDDLDRRELGWIADALELGARLGLARLAAGADADLSDLTPGTRRDFATRTERLAAGLEPLWLARSRPGGLDDSRRRLQGPDGLVGLLGAAPRATI